MWRDPIEDPPAENTDVLVYTDENKFKVARLCKGRWDTYQRIVYWSELPKAPEATVTVPTRGRKKKEKK